MDMQPQQTPGHNNYDFIMSPNQPTQPSRLSGSSKTQRILFVGISAIVLIILIIIVSSLLNSGPNNKETLLKITQQQTELARIAQLNTAGASQTTKNVAMNTSITLTSDRNQLLKTLAARGIKIKDNQLIASRNLNIDKTLDQARAASAFDATFLQTLEESLTDYQTTLKTAYDQSESKSIKQELSHDYSDAKLLSMQIAKGQ
jgi:hypothetical protein